MEPDAAIKCHALLKLVLPLRTYQETFCESPKKYYLNHGTMYSTLAILLKNYFAAPTADDNAPGKIRLIARFQFANGEAAT
jgi:hypothetical protein